MFESKCNCPNPKKVRSTGTSHREVCVCKNCGRHYNDKTALDLTVQFDEEYELYKFLIENPEVRLSMTKAEIGIAYLRYDHDDGWPSLNINLDSLTEPAELGAWINIPLYVDGGENLDWDFHLSTTRPVLCRVRRSGHTDYPHYRLVVGKTMIGNYVDSDDEKWRLAEPVMAGEMEIISKITNQRSEMSLDKLTENAGELE